MALIELYMIRRTRHMGTTHNAIRITFSNRIFGLAIILFCQLYSLDFRPHENPSLRQALRQHQYH